MLTKARNVAHRATDIVYLINDIRLIYYGNGSYREASNEFQFIFDYKGLVTNVNIGTRIEDNDVYNSLIEIDYEKELITNEMKASLCNKILWR